MQNIKRFVPRTVFILILLYLRHSSAVPTPSTTPGLDSSAVPTPSEYFPYKEQIDPHGNYFLFWDRNGTHVTMEVHVRTHGYVGFGLSPNGNMFPADIVIGWVKDGHTFFKVNTTTYYNYGLYNDKPLMTFLERLSFVCGSVIIIRILLVKRFYYLTSNWIFFFFLKYF